MTHGAEAVVDQQWACSIVAAKWMFGSNRLKKHGVKIIHNGINVRQYRYNEDIRLEYRKKFEITDKRVLGSIARFEEQKNHIFMLEVFRRYIDIYPNSVLVLVGDGSKRESIMKEIRDKGLDNAVLYLGVRNDIDKLLQMFDIFLLPSLYEGLPFVGIEAQASGLPILASDTVSQELMVTDLVSMMSLKSSINEWVIEIDKLYIKNKFIRSQKHYEEILSKKGYDISESIKLLEEYYTELCK